MPTRVLINLGSVLLGGLIGGFVGNKLSEHFKAQQTRDCGVCSMGMGIYSIAPMKNMPAVIFALVIGTAIGLIVHIGNGI
ncbi:DUF554 family protein, partial [Enterococcus faecium]|uniref:DUF554 family protein n=1 Tax=Enterococcus faecium TaxID=1352 RepID=UPI0031CCEF39